ncbi:hypothetical protein A5M85_07275 [Cellulophaga lytica]|uniref:acyltransferase n=1 Tax=Cellulophaga lytica TaxID=979 RepID=UPI0009504B6A|nr:acyltransferase [Cellulophaga lytica]APU10090.1 hypothetical protein A5M85_07275 [Cellulophaga lytica]
MSFRAKITVLNILIMNRVNCLLPNYPKHRVLYKPFECFRQKLWKKLFKSFGEKSYIRSGVEILGYNNICIGNNCIIGPDSILNASQQILIGDYFLSGPQLVIYTAEHGILNNGEPFIFQPNNYSRVIIGDNVYLGARVMILKGVNIGDNVVVAAGSIVTSNIPSNQLWGGVPAKKIKNL